MIAETNKPMGMPETDVVVESDSRAFGSDPVEEVVLETDAASLGDDQGERVGAESNSILAVIDPELSDSEKKQIAEQVIDHIQQHARAHGNFSGFADFVAQCDRIIVETRAGAGKQAVTLANSLARDVSSLVEAVDTLAPEMRALLYRGITTGFLYANLKREIAPGRPRPADRFTREDYLAEVAKKPTSRTSLAKSLGVSLRALRSWEKKHHVLQA